MTATLGKSPGVRAELSLRRPTMTWEAAMISKGILRTVNDGRFFLSVCKSAALLLFVGAKTIALACGYDDPKSAAGQRAALNLSYPNALDVVGAVAQARLTESCRRLRTSAKRLSFSPT